MFDTDLVELCLAILWVFTAIPVTTIQDFSVS